MEFFFLVASAILILGVIGSLTPLLPGALISLVGVFLYWWSTGYQDPGMFVMALLVSTGLLAVAFDWLSSFLSASISGATKRTTIAAGIIGVLLFFVAGPVGTIIGVGTTVAVRSYLVSGELEESLKAGIYTGLGILGSTLVQFMLTLLMLAIFVLSYLI